MSKTAEPVISTEMLEALKALGIKVPKKREKPSPELTAERKAKNEAECIRVFTEAGYSDVQPHVNVLTHGKIKEDGTVTGWLGKGRQVRKGEKSHQVGPFKLFHIDQTDPVKADSTVH